MTLEFILIFVAMASIIANILITALNFKLYTEYWKDNTIKARLAKRGE